jgi:hypothetical protein
MKDYIFSILRTYNITLLTFNVLIAYRLHCVIKRHFPLNRGLSLDVEKRSANLMTYLRSY